MPGLGTSSSKFQLSVGWRYADAQKSYFDSRLNHDFMQRWQPTERLSVLDVTGRYAFNNRLSLLVSLPVVFNRFSTLLPPVATGTGSREAWRVRGIGDVSVYSEALLFNPKKHPFHNLALGVGLKTPTGNWNVNGTLPDQTGSNFARRAVWPPAIMPGDGGLGIIVGFNGYKIIRAQGPLRDATIFGSGSYLISPRNTNGTQSIISSLGVPLTSNFAGQLVNSVPDTYNAQAGISFRVPKTWDKKNLKGLRVRFVSALEGLKTHDLFGGNDGFRQPGWAFSIGPGISYARKKDFLVVDIPFVIARHIDPGKTNLPGLPVIVGGNALAAPFNRNRQMGLVAPMSIAVRYVRSF